jgi:transcriptional regulator with GAF, ATPase, and Fis domain
MIARARLQGLCPYSPLVVRQGGAHVAVQACATLLAEGEQEHLGFTMRWTPPGAGAMPGSLADMWPGLNGVRAQLGALPLGTLLQEAASAVERHLVEAALRSSAGNTAAAARLLMVQPHVLAHRMRSLGMVARGADDAALPPVLN